MKKKEFIFIGCVLLAALLLWLGLNIGQRGDYGSIEITVDGEIYGTYSLAEDQTIAIGDTNVCEISGGKVKMTEADCPDHLCMKQHAIGSSGGTIVCLPNKVVITGISGTGETTDGFDTAV